MYCLMITDGDGPVHIKMFEEPIYEYIHGHTISQAQWGEVDKKGKTQKIDHMTGSGFILVKQGTWEHGEG
jgi:hypothetical protein